MDHRIHLPADRGGTALRLPNLPQLGAARVASRMRTGCATAERTILQRSLVAQGRRRSPSPPSDSRRNPRDVRAGRSPRTRSSGSGLG